MYSWYWDCHCGASNNAPTEPGDGVPTETSFVLVNPVCVAINHVQYLASGALAQGTSATPTKA